MANDEFREQQAAAREVGLKARHETRVERAIRREIAIIQKALDALPAECRYHGDQFEVDYGLHGVGSCCDTGKPSMYRAEAMRALRRIQETS